MCCAHLGDKLTILDARTVYGLNRTEEQLDLIQGFVTSYRPSVVIVEADSQQKGLGNDERLRAMGMRHGFTIRPHRTQGKKMDDVFGVASMDQSFRKGEIRIPWGDQNTIDKMIPLVSQLRAWRPDIKTRNLTQDLVMALWFVHLYWFQLRRVHTEAPAPAWRPTELLLPEPVRA
jgi:hypothetical protein